MPIAVNCQAGRAPPPARAMRIDVPRRRTKTRAPAGRPDRPALEGRRLELSDAVEAAVQGDPHGPRGGNRDDDRLRRGEPSRPRTTATGQSPRRPGQSPPTRPPPANRTSTARCPGRGVPCPRRRFPRDTRRRCAAGLLPQADCRRQGDGAQGDPVQPLRPDVRETQQVVGDANGDQRKAARRPTARPGRQTGPRPAGRPSQTAARPSRRWPGR